MFYFAANNFSALQYSYVSVVLRIVKLQHLPHSRMPSNTSATTQREPRTKQLMVDGWLTNCRRNAALSDAEGGTHKQLDQIFEKQASKQ